MSIGVLTMTTPLMERIDRWATSGKANSILLHPEDYLKIQGKKDQIETKYNLPIVILGGARGLQEYLNRGSNNDDVDPAVLATQMAGIQANLDDVFQSEE